MILEQTQIPQAINYPFNWVADYFDGTSLTEFDLKEHKANNFYGIKQSETRHFGLFGQNMKFYFDNISGHFYLNGKRVEILYKVDNTIFNLTNNPRQKDLITFKQAHTNFNRNVIEQKTNIDSFNFGYKTNINQHDTQFFFQPVVSIPLNSTVFMEIKLTSNRDLDGELIFYVSGKEVERFKAPLQRNVSGQINWTVKRG